MLSRKAEEGAEEAGEGVRKTTRSLIAAAELRHGGGGA
jgi:hypothetical protein